LLVRVISHWLAAHQISGDALVLARRVAYVVFVAIAVAVALGIAFQSPNVTLAGIILATLVASLGIQDLMRNYVSGFYVLLEKHVRPGDHIRFDNIEGVVSDIRLRVTLLRGEGGAVVVVPNAELFNKSLIVQREGARVSPRRRTKLAGGPEQDPAEGVEPVSR
jgi:small-conductance mechanosensitive channel